MADVLQLIAGVRSAINGPPDPLMPRSNAMGERGGAPSPHARTDMTERVVDVFDKNGICLTSYAVRITAFNRTLCCEDFEREALWMASRDKIVSNSQLAWLTAKVRPDRGSDRP